jgi:DHA3 family tetracycline resistance protein-like MFS transporter
MLGTLRHREFRLLWAGQSISLVGDGIFFVALPWQVYELSNAPTALAVVGIAWTLPMVLSLLAAGVASDRLDRRSVLIAGDLLRMMALGGMAALSLAGVIELWHLLVLSVVYGVGEALFQPSFTALIPQVVPQEDLLRANALKELVEPLGIRFVGPALGGVTIELLDVGAALALDAATFAASLVALLFIAPKPAAVRVDPPSMRQDLAEAWRYVRAHAWLWVTLASAALSLLASYGPMEVLLPYVIKNDLEQDAATFGFVLGAGGVGAILAAVIVGRSEMPRRAVTLMYASWTVATLLTGGFALASDATQMYAIAFVIFGANTIGMIVWNTLMHTLVPSELLGRVSSLDWFVSIGLIPVSFAITGPVAELVGAQATLIGAGVLGAIGMIVLFFAVPAVRDPERLTSATAPTPVL